MQYSVLFNSRGTVVRAMAAVLAVLLLCLGMAAPAQAATRTVRTAGYVWDATTGTLTVTSDEGTTNWQSAIDPSAVQHIVLAEGVTTVRNRAFRGCAVYDVAFGSTVSHIGTNAFGECANLACVNIPYTVTAVAENAFRGSGICSYTLADTYIIPGWLEDAIETQAKRSGITAYVIYVPTSMMSYYEDAMALLAHNLGVSIDVQAVTASPYASVVALTDADDGAGYKEFNAGVARQIRAAATDSIVRITTDRYMSFDRQVYAAIEERQDVTIVVNYSYHGEAHTFYIVDGTLPFFLYGGKEYISFRYLENKLSNDQT